MNEKELLKEIHRASSHEQMVANAREIPSISDTAFSFYNGQYKVSSLILSIFKKHNYKPENENE
jgi:hypothetical protein